MALRIFTHWQSPEHRKLWNYETNVRFSISVRISKQYLYKKISRDSFDKKSIDRIKEVSIERLQKFVADLKLKCKRCRITQINNITVNCQCTSCTRISCFLFDGLGGLQKSIRSFCNRSTTMFFKSDETIDLAKSKHFLSNVRKSLTIIARDDYASDTATRDRGSQSDCSIWISNRDTPRADSSMTFPGGIRISNTL